MNTLEKLQDVATHMELEPDGETAVSPAQMHQVAACGQLIPKDPPRHRPKPTRHSHLGVTPLVMPGGKTLPALKTLLTTACERDCYYCPFRAGRTYRRHTFSPDEMAKTFMDMVRAGLVKGLFLSSGIINGGVTTQDKLIATAELLREKYRFRGYIHLKVMPGAEKEQVRRSMQVADRLSVNLEAPNDHRLAMLAPKKQFFDELLQPLAWIESIRQNERPFSAWNGRWPSSVTQFVVGGVGETDLELLFISELLINKYNLGRIYYSAFRPLPDTPMANVPAETPLRSHRLYQTSFLLRDYGFNLEELPFDPSGNLPLTQDPKQAWADANLLHEPVELNRAERQQLLRVPGVGPKSANRILTARQRGALRELKDLQNIGVATSRLASYVLLDGKRPFRQLPLWPLNQQ